LKKHLAMQMVDISHNVEGNGVASNTNQIVPTRQLTLPTDMVKILNCKLWRDTCQWVSYYLMRDMPCNTILDLTSQPPALALQVLKHKSTSKLTMYVKTSDTRASKQVLDWATSVSACNTISVTCIDCITELTNDLAYDLVVLNPVSQTGRLNSSILLEVERIFKCSSATSIRSSPLLLPFRLELWCVVISSKDLARRSHLVSNEQVLDFIIADQINILAVTHQQDINYQGLEKLELCNPLIVTTVELVNISLDRETFVSKCPVTAAGLGNGVVYWFVMDFGWNIKLSTLESEAYNQAMFVCKEQMVEVGDELNIKCQTERGLLDFQFDVVKKVNDVGTMNFQL